VSAERLSVGTGPPTVVVAILNWNNLPDTLECVGSVLASDYASVAVWVVDNGSEPDPSRGLLSRYPCIRVLRQACNLGYGGGNNVALRAAMAEGAAYVLLLNNDAVVSRDTITRLTAAMEADERIAMATPRVFFYDRPSEVYWDGGRIDWRSGATPHDSSSLTTDDSIRRSEWLDGCCLLVRVEAIRDIGVLDERYFLYYEDVDWTVRAARRGWLNVVVPNASAWHRVSRSTGSFLGPLASFYYARNRYLFLRAQGRFNGNPFGLLSYARMAYADYRLRIDSAESRRAVMEAYWDLMRGRSGKYVPLGHRRILACGDSCLLTVTRLGAFVKRVISALCGGLAGSRADRRGRITDHL